MVKKNVAKYKPSSGSILGRAKGFITSPATQAVLRAAGQKALQRLQRASRKSRSKSTKRDNTYATISGISHNNDMKEIKPKTILVGRRKGIKTVGSFKLTHINQGVNNGVQGLQQCYDTTQLFSKAHLNGTAADLTTDDAFYGTKWSTSPWELNPYVVPQLNPIYTTVPTAVGRTDKMLIKDVHQCYDVINLNAVSCKVDVYFYLCIKDGNNTPVGLWLQYMLAKGYQQPLQSLGPNNMANTPQIGYPVAIDLYEKPPKEFRKWFKVLSKKSFILKGGDTIKIAHKYIYNKMLINEDILRQGTNFVKGFTILPMMVVNGALVGYEPDGAPAGTAATQVSFAKTKIGWVSRETITFSALPINRFDIQRTEIGILQNTTNRQVVIDVDEDRIEGLTEA